MAPEAEGRSEKSSFPPRVSASSSAALPPRVHGFCFFFCISLATFSQLLFSCLLPPQLSPCPRFLSSPPVGGWRCFWALCRQALCGWKCHRCFNHRSRSVLKTITLTLCFVTKRCALTVSLLHLMLSGFGKY